MAGSRAGVILDGRRLSPKPTMIAARSFGNIGIAVSIERSMLSSSRANVAGDIMKRRGTPESMLVTGGLSVLGSLAARASGGFMSALGARFLWREPEALARRGR